MKIFPRNSDEWLAFTLLPFKAWTIIAPVMLAISTSVPGRGRTGPNGVEEALVGGLLVAGIIQLFFALVFFLDRKRRNASVSLSFGFVAFILGYGLLPAFAMG